METTDLDFDEPTNLDDISKNLDSIENELLILNRQLGKIAEFKGIEGLLFFILITLIVIAFKLP